MNIIEAIFPMFGIFLLLFGIIIMTANQFRLMKNISKWSVVKAYCSFIPFILLYFLKFDNQVKIICRDYQKTVRLFETGLTISIIAITTLSLTKYL
jgi:uncharacterized membrane protein SirB2